MLFFYPLLPGRRGVAVLLLAFASSCGLAADFDVRAFGAKGDGRTVDSAAINQAIDAAAAAGGGVVRLPAGTYLSFSIHLKSHLTLQFDPGATLLAAAPSPEAGGYDPAEPNEWGDRLQYQDFGHSHWHNSLIWGENLTDVSIVGPGLIDGTKGLSRNAGPIGRGPNGTGPAGTGGPVNSGGVGNKAIALKNCRQVVLRDLSLLMGGHFALLATGVDDLTIDNVRIDTNRDGLDLDSCRHVRVANCAVNTPNDDAIVLKSSFALGAARACEHVTITNCQVSGYDAGTFFDGTCQRTLQRAPDRDGPTGRIKLGTESNGGFRNITISNCVFDRCRGLALETVDGGAVEDIAISNITMREVTTAPLFLRIGNRARGPAGTPIATMRRISISNLVVSDADPRYASIIAGLPDHPIEDVRLSNVRIAYRGGLTMEQVAKQPPELVNTFFLRTPGQRGDAPATSASARDPFDVPERENGYPEPSMFGLLPAYGLFVRHARNVTVDNVEVSFAQADERPAVVLVDVTGAEFARVKAQRAGGAPLFVLRGVRDFAAHDCRDVPDTNRANAENETLP